MRFLQTSDRMCVLLLSGIAVGCSTYHSVAEFWPNFDAADPSLASGGGPPVPLADAGSAVGGGSGASGDTDAGAPPNGGGSGGTGGGSSGGGSSSSGGGSGAGGSGGDAATEDAGGSTVADAGSGALGGPDGGARGGCSLAVTVTTVTDNGGYSPHNIGAIWVAHGSGAFVKTLAVWAKTRINHLTLWNSATTAAGLSRSTVDAVTGATLSTHQTHNVTWNCADKAEVQVPDGPYRVYFEMTDDNVTGPNLYVDFTKGPAPLTLSPPDAPYFKGIKLVYVP